MTETELLIKLKIIKKSTSSLPIYGSSEKLLSNLIETAKYKCKYCKLLFNGLSMLEYLNNGYRIRFNISKSQISLNFPGKLQTELMNKFSITSRSKELCITSKYKPSKYQCHAYYDDEEKNIWEKENKNEC